MPFAQRHGGVVVGLYANLQKGFAEEFLKNDSPEVVEFNKRGAVSQVTILYPADLWRRMTDDEVVAVESVISTQPARIRRIFNAATEYRSDDELWPLLQEIASDILGSQRASEILAASN
ncbi:hypothetical protein G6M16_008665 [Agrobacterium tumefaciens]|nr:hypothetical protein G6M16_008665 [Agrobacterium tumefaciens]